jgi:hypothetical protein
MRVHGTKLGAISTGRGLGDQLYDLAGQVPSLDLNFAGTKTLDPLVTFTRASSGTYTDSAGVIQTAATDVPRFDHDPTTGESLGLLVEEQRTNLLLRSEEFDNASWGVLNVTVSANTQVAPNGTTSAETITDVNGVTSANVGCFQSIVLADSTTYAMSCYVKAGTKTTCRVGIRDKAGTNIFANFNLTAVSTTVGNAVSSTIQDAGNGWYRCTAICASLTGATSQRGLVFMDTGSYTADGTGTIHVWGAQLEAGAFPTSYIPTTTAAATRSADVASSTGSNYTSWANNNEGTVFSDSSIIASQVKTQAVWELSGGTVPSSLRQPQGTANQFRAVIGGTFTGSPGTGATLTTGVTRAAVAYSGTAGRLQVESAASNPTGSALDATSLSIGSLAGSTHLNGRIKRLCFWPTRLANSTLQQITQ